MLKGLKNYSHIFSSITNHKKIKIKCKKNDLATNYFIYFSRLKILRNEN